MGKRIRNQNQWTARARGWRLLIRNFGLRIVDLLSSEIRDCVTQESLGRGLILPFPSGVRLIGYRGRSLVPRFIPQKRLSFWKQGIGFTAQAAPDFPNVAAQLSTFPPEEGSKVLCLVVTHLAGEEFTRLMDWWKPFCPEEDLWIVFGGKEEEFKTLNHPNKVFVDDTKLRTRDHQREKQSYCGILKATATIIEQENPEYVYLCEYDHLPVQSDFLANQITEMRSERADVMVHYLDRIDQTQSPFGLFHDADPEFASLWKDVSLRDNSSVVFWMFGSGSLWTREAFLAVSVQQPQIECYFEVYLPTMAHHLGFRVRPWRGENHLVTNLTSPEITLEAAQKKGSWTVHPVKELMVPKIAGRL